jgi:hypothetical protein
MAKGITRAAESPRAATVPVRGGQPSGGLAQIGLTDDGVPLEHGPGLVARQAHGDPLGHRSPHQRRRRRPPQVVEQHARPPAASHAVRQAPWNVRIGLPRRGSAEPDPDDPNRGGVPLENYAEPSRCFVGPAARMALAHDQRQRQ